MVARQVGPVIRRRPKASRSGVHEQGLEVGETQGSEEHQESPLLSPTRYPSPSLPEIPSLMSPFGIKALLPCCESPLGQHLTCYQPPGRNGHRWPDSTTGRPGGVARGRRRLEPHPEAAGSHTELASETQGGLANHCPHPRPGCFSGSRADWRPRILNTFPRDGPTLWEPLD